MNTLPLNPSNPISLSIPYKFNHTTKARNTNLKFGFSRGRIRAVGTLPDSTEDQAKDPQETPHVDFAFVHARPLSNCVGGGICGTCLVEVVEGKELLSPRNEIEKEKLKKKPKTFRLACQTTVGDPNTTGLVVIQQLPEWKGHEWYDQKVLPSELDLDQQ
ncbi:photosynthetic NDH subunit of subcomplex B 3, chloroplastic isoform X2 [Tripterygium wilfordii]|uniref:photosynthetic NDH subunit of subcomplex B 3, chloroplastic isoform X2 n=1 Tax=Tripterygium wilfordii TaxID=458696 RepID=UPI0018F801F5|nr:photosynthetic NDH subunit of subcomplex B 3, chloroplastic isoform X2 [Tripterygium wilfordii]